MRHTTIIGASARLGLLLTVVAAGSIIAQNQTPANVAPVIVMGAAHAVELCRGGKQGAVLMWRSEMISKLPRIGFLLAAMATSPLYGQNQTPENVAALVRNDVFSLSYVDLGDAVELTMTIGKEFFPSLQIDVNQNRMIDANVDTYYTMNGNSSCIGFLVKELVTRPCGSFNSNAKLYITEGRVPDQQQIKWVIPKNEFGNISTGTSFAVVVYDATNKRFLNFADFDHPYSLTYAPISPH